MSACIDHGQKGSTCRGKLAGYGRTRFQGQVTGIHRKAYCVANSVTLESIKGLVVRHTCDNPRCINPEHLLLGTASDNMQDRNLGLNNLLGERNPQAKRSAQDIKAIREAYKSGVTQKQLAQQYQTSQGYISNIIRGRVWHE